MEDHKVGEKFEYEGKTYRAISVCHYCALNRSCSNPSEMRCSSESRVDDSEVCYEEVKLEDSKAMKFLRYVFSLLYSLSFMLTVTAGLFVFLGRQHIWLPIGISGMIEYIGNTILMDKERK